MENFTSETKVNNDLEKLKNQFDNASEDIKLRFKIKLQRYNKEMIYSQL